MNAATSSELILTLTNIFFSQYASLFVHPSWRELLDSKDDDGHNEIVARVLKYLNSGDNRCGM